MIQGYNPTVNKINKSDVYNAYIIVVLVADDATPFKLPTVEEFKSTDTIASRPSDRYKYGHASHRGNSAQGFVSIVTPILEKEENFQKLYGYQDARARVTLDFPLLNSEDKPLQFVGTLHQPVLSETCEPNESEVAINNPTKPLNLQLKTAPSVTKREVCVPTNHASSGGTLKGDNSPQKNSFSNLADMYGGSSSESEDLGETSVTRT